MQIARCVRALVPVVMLGLAGSLLGCGESIPTPTPPDPVTSKKIAEEMKNAAMEKKAAQRERMRGRGAR